MFACSASAIGLLKCCGQPEPSTRELASFVPVIIAAARAIVSPIAHSSRMRGSSVSRK